jgi:hypothetical protein
MTTADWERDALFLALLTAIALYLGRPVWANRREHVRRLRNWRGRALGYGACARCGDTWDWARHHDTNYARGRGVFALCENCWAGLTPAERLPYYRALLATWEPAARRSLGPLVEYAVLHERDARSLLAKEEEP